MGDRHVDRGLTGLVGIDKPAAFDRSDDTGVLQAGRYRESASAVVDDPADRDFGPQRLRVLLGDRRPQLVEESAAARIPLGG